MAIDIKELTLSQIEEILSKFSAIVAVAQPKHPYEIGSNYFVRTVTHHQCGRLVAVFPTELVFEDTSWIADDGIFTEALASGEFHEVEMFAVGHPVIVGRGALIDCQRVDFAIPKSRR